MHDIRNMCMKYDIIFLQETWLSKNDNALLKDVDDNFDAFGISAMNDENGYQTGRLLGGTCIATDNACKLVINLIFNTIICMEYTFSMDTYDEIYLKCSSMYINIRMSKSNITDSPDGNQLNVIDSSYEINKLVHFTIHC